jgi:hypothetical protein
MAQQRARDGDQHRPAAPLARRRSAIAALVAVRLIG